MSFRIEYQPASCSFDEFHELDVECFPEEPISAEAFAGFVTNDFWAAYDGNSLVGYSYVVRKPDVAWLSRIGTAGEYRNRGIATRLMESVVYHCSHIGLADIILYVQSDNPSAIRLYERFGFRTIESAYQFVLRIADIPGSVSDHSKDNIVAVPITEVSESSWPNFPREWRNIIEMHKPPNSHVLVFHDRVGNTVGYCRLNPGFPGCFPFVVRQPSANLWPTLRSLQTHLLPEKEILKLTFSDQALACACNDHGLELNYKLLKMLRSGKPQS